MQNAEMNLIPISKDLEDNKEFQNHPDCSETLEMSINFYEKIGYNPPWIGYYAKLNGNYVGTGGFKGSPQDGKVEIAYGTFETQRNKGVGNLICKELVKISLKEDPSVIITARTLPQKSHSTSILEKNNFKLLGEIYDEEDGQVWEWKYFSTNSQQ